MHEASIGGAGREAGATDTVVLVGEKGHVSQFESVEVRLLVVSSICVGLLMAFTLHGAGRRRIGANGLSEICCCTNGLDCFVAHESDFLGAVLILAVLLLLLLLLQEVFLQRQRLDILIGRLWLYKYKKK